jgi:hypothetical protein
MRISSMIALLLAASLPCLAQATLPPGAVIQGTLKEDAGRWVAEAPAKVVLPFPAGTDQACIRLQTGKDPAGVLALVACQEGGPVSVSLRPRELKLSTGQSFADAYLELPWGARVFVRPNAEFYPEARRTELAKSWETLPAASAHLATLEVRRAGEVLQLWVDGRFLNELPAKGALKSLELRLPAGAALHGIAFST